MINGVSDNNPPCSYSSRNARCSQDAAAAAAATATDAAVVAAAAAAATTAAAISLSVRNGD